MRDDSYSSTHPPLPPTTEDDRVAWLRLLRSRRVRPGTFYRLLAEHGSAQAALAALPQVAQAVGVENYTPCPPGVVQAELRAARGLGAELICVGQATYPAALYDLPDPPPVLWARGDIALLQRPAIALVGARNASSLGTRMSRALALGCGAAGFVVVSGLARGIDATALSAGLPHGTIAVKAGGLDVIYPPEHQNLAQQIATQGLIVSEQPMGMAPKAGHFPRRNRLISGLAQAVVVVEAAARSGSTGRGRKRCTCGVGDFCDLDFFFVIYSFLAYNSFSLKKKILFAILLIFNLELINSKADEIRVIAVVNEEIITSYDLYKEVKLMVGGKVRGQKNIKAVDFKPNVGYYEGINVAKIILNNNGNGEFSLSDFDFLR